MCAFLSVLLFRVAVLWVCNLKAKAKASMPKPWEGSLLTVFKIRALATAEPKQLLLLLILHVDSWWELNQFLKITISINAQILSRILLQTTTRGYVERKTVKDCIRIFGLSTWKGRISFNSDGKELLIEGLGLRCWRLVNVSDQELIFRNFNLKYLKICI